MAKGKKEVTPRQFFAGAGLAYVIGLVYTIVTFQAILGPGMLVLGTIFLVLGLRKKKPQQPPPAP